METICTLPPLFEHDQMLFKPSRGQVPKYCCCSHLTHLVFKANCLLVPYVTVSPNRAHLGRLWNSRFKLSLTIWKYLSPQLDSQHSLSQSPFMISEHHEHHVPALPIFPAHHGSTNTTNRLHRSRVRSRPRRATRVSPSFAPSRFHAELTFARSFRFDAEPEPDFSDSDPENDDEALRAFNQEVLEDAQDEEMDEGVSDEESDLVAITNDAVDLLKQHNAAETDQQPESGESDVVDDAPQPEPEDGAMADEEDEVAPASPVRPTRTPTKKAAKSPVKKPAKPSTNPSTKATPKATTTTPAKSPAKAPARRTRKPKKELPDEKPTRISDRVSKPRARAAAQTNARPKPAAGSRKKTTTKAAPKPKTSGQEWEIESVVGSMIDQTHQHFYEVKWKNFSSKENTWEPKVNLANCQAAIRAFEDGKVKGKGGKRKSS